MEQRSTKTSFTDCSTEDEESSGGAISISLTEDSQLLVDGSIASFCSCDQTEGCGGFMFINATVSDTTTTFSSSPLPLTFRGAIFDRNHAAHGNDVFILCDEGVLSDCALIPIFP